MIKTNVDMEFANSFVSTFYIFVISKKKKMKYENKVVLLLGICVFALLSCSSSQNNNDDDSDIRLGNYESITFKIAPEIAPSALEANQYTVDSVRILNIQIF